MSNASFKVVYVDPDGSGLTYSNHLGKTITNAFRCCENCTCIFGKLGNSNQEMGPFITGELEPLNDEARRVQEEIDAYKKSMGWC